MFNLSQDIGNDLLKSSVVKQLLGYGFFSIFCLFGTTLQLEKLKVIECVSENSETCCIFINYTCMLGTTTYYWAKSCKSLCQN